jgi:hypothetical protein
MEPRITPCPLNPLTVRFNAYRTIYFDNDNPPLARGANRPAYEALQNRVQGGGFQPNPARSWIVGVIGLHRAGEPFSMPGDRQLAGSLGGPAFARLNDNSLVLDLANTIAEANPQGAKAKLGDLTVSAGGATLTTLTEADYDQAAYERTSGIIAVDLTSDQVRAAQDNNLQVSSATGGTLDELELRATLDGGNLYFEGG